MLAEPFNKPTVPSTLIPSLNRTVPVGVPLGGGVFVTVAVKVIDSPTQTLLVEAVRAVTVGGLVTVTLLEFVSVNTGDEVKRIVIVEAVS